MRAWQLPEVAGTDAYRLVDVEEPVPGPGEVRVALKVSGLNHLDLWVAEGKPAPKALPHVGGSDGAGVVDAVGEGVAGFEIGDEVIIDPTMSCGHCARCRNDEPVFCDQFEILGEGMPGTLTEKIVIPVINAVRKPARVEWDVAGTFGLVSATAMRMLERVRLEHNETVLVVGIGGGVSSAAFHLAKGLGATVYVTSRSPVKIEKAIAAGAAGGFDSAGEFGKEMTELGGADVVIENVGPVTFKQSMRAAKKGGRIAVCGATSGPRLDLNLPVVWFRQLELIGSSMGSHAQFQRALYRISQGKAESPVDQMFDFDEVPGALRHLATGDQIGKVGIRVG